MSISTSVKALLNMTGHRQLDLMELLKVSSKQALSNKFSGERWSASDLVSVAELCGCRLAFVFPDGERVVISGDDPVQPLPMGESGVLPGPGLPLRIAATNQKPFPVTVRKISEKTKRDPYG